MVFANEPMAFIADISSLNDSYSSKQATPPTYGPVETDGAVVFSP